MSARKLRIKAKATKFPLTYGKPAGTLPSVLDGVTKGTKKARLITAIAHDNRGQWFLAESRRYNVAQIEQLSFSGKLGTALYERMGGLLQGPKPYIYIQIALVQDVIDGTDPVSGEPLWKTVPSYHGERDPEWAVFVCLKDIGIELMQPMSDADVRAALKAGHY